MNIFTTFGAWANTEEKEEKQFNQLKSIDSFHITLKTITITFHVKASDSDFEIMNCAERQYWRFSKWIPEYWLILTKVRGQELHGEQFHWLIEGDGYQQLKLKREKHRVRSVVPK